MSVEVYEVGKIYYGETVESPHVVILYMRGAPNDGPYCIVLAADGTIRWKYLSNSQRSMIE